MGVNFVLTKIVSVKKNDNYKVWIQINFAPPRPAGLANFRGAGRGGAALFSRGGAGRPSLMGISTNLELPMS